jgi:hypothetical protein
MPEFEFRAMLYEVKIDGVHELATYPKLPGMACGLRLRKNGSIMF